jgi:diguanylate cyclase (GGDEF)-like protein
LRRGRYGGEEFLIVLAECSPSDLAVSAERMRACVSKKPVETDAGPIPVTLSIGSVAGNALGDPVLNGEQLLRTADTALYCAKTNGRNRVERAPDTNLASAAGAQ